MSIATPKGKVEARSYSRRRFAGSAAVAAAAVLFEPSLVAEGSEALQTAPGIGPRPEDLSVADWGEVEARYANVLRVYGERLSVEERRRMVHILSTNQRMLASIRTFDVQNGDPAACTLRVVNARS